MVKKFGLFTGLTVFTYASSLPSVENIDTFWIWIAVFALGGVGVLILFFSSLQMSKIQQMHDSVIQKQLEMEKNQALILTGMSENIHSMAKEALSKSTEAVERVNAHMMPKSTGNAKNSLLDVTNDLIDFLRLKSRKIEILNEEFNLNNVLNEISGTMASHFKGSNVELIFDIDNSVPRLITGDSLHFGQILSNILENRLSVLNNEELKLDISMYNAYEEKIELQFQLIDDGPGMSQEEVEKLFVPYYNEENGQYAGLGLFVAQELVTMMNGELSIHSTVGKGSSFTLTLPFEKVEPENQRKYRLPDKILTDKKVLIVDSNYNSSLAIKKMFSYFKHDVKILSREKFMDAMPKLDNFDIVVLDDALFNMRTINYISGIKEKKELKVVSLASILNAEEGSSSDVVDKTMLKPLNQERIFEMITTMYELKTIPELSEEESSSKAKIYRSTILETSNINQNSFTAFSGKRLLIVEDNVINQKVLLNILKHSGMDINVANNGAEAVKMVQKLRKKENYDLVLMDINMPVMDGYGATKVIRAEKEFDALPIVAFTALVLDSEIEKMFSCGINAFLGKPLNVGKLYTAMAMYLLDMPNKYNAVETPVLQKKKLPGLDTERGIRYTNNCNMLYTEILLEFVAAYGKSDVVFAKLVREKRYEQLKMLCLDMKGLSGTIGAKEMNQKIDEVQKLLLYNKHELLVDYISVYEKELATLVQSIALYNHR